MKVLVTAYACNPYLGSEHAVGWNLIRELSQLHDLTVIAEEEKCADSIIHYKSLNNDMDHVKFIFIQKKRARTLRKFWPPSYYWFYKNWQKKALGVATNLAKSGEYDIVHHLTMVGFREPGFLFELGIPYVIGPVGGFGYFPRHFSSVMSWHGRIYFILYNLINYFHGHYHRRFRKAVQKAGIFGTIAASHYNANFIKKCYGIPVHHVVPEIGPPSNPISPNHNKFDFKRTLKIIWVGNLSDGKALPLLLNALTSFKNSEFQLSIYGDGRQKTRWVQKVYDLGLDNTVKFEGSVPRAKLMQAYQDADLCVITSLRDLSSMVTVEALAHALPILCLDHCGFGEIVDTTCGVKVDVVTAEQVVRDLQSRLRDISQGNINLKSLSSGALAKAQELSWENKAKVISQIYHEKVQNSVGP